MVEFNEVKHPGATILHSWNLLTADTDGDAIEVPGASDRTAQFVGSNWGGATAILEGSLDGGTTWFGLKDGQGDAITFTIDGGEMVAENCLKIRARLSVAGTAADIMVYLLSRSTMR